MRGFEVTVLVIAVLFFMCTAPVSARTLPDSSSPRQTPGMHGDWVFSSFNSGIPEGNLSPASPLPIWNGRYVIDEETIAASPYIAHPWSAGEHHLFTMATWAAAAESASPTSVISGYGEYAIPVKIEEAWDRTIEVPVVVAYGQSYGYETGRRRT